MYLVVTRLSFLIVSVHITAKDIKPLTFELFKSVSGYPVTTDLLLHSL